MSWEVLLPLQCLGKFVLSRYYFLLRYLVEFLYQWSHVSLEIISVWRFLQFIFYFFFRRYKVIQVIYFFLCELWYLFQGICPLHLINKFIGMKVFIIFSRVISPFLFLTLVICVLQLFFSLICLEVYQYYWLH